MDGTGVLGISAAELDRITAMRIEIGGTSTTSQLTVSAPIAPAGTSIDIGKGEALYVGEQAVTRLEGGAPAFITEDPFNAIDPRINPGTTPVPDPDQTPMECRV